MRVSSPVLLGLWVLASACSDAPSSSAEERSTPPESDVRVVPPAPSLPDGSEVSTRSPESRAAADSVWAAFQAALRAGDREALSQLVADTLNPHTVAADGWVMSRTTPEHAQFIDHLLDGPTREALLAIDQLEHTPRFSAVAFETDQEDGTLTHGYGFEEVAPGDWRLVTSSTQWGP